MTPGRYAAAIGAWLVAVPFAAHHLGAAGWWAAGVVGGLGAGGAALSVLLDSWADR